MLLKDKFLKSKKGAAVLAVFYTFLWGCAFPLVKICITQFQITDSDNNSKILLAGIRFFLSGVITVLLCPKKESFKRDKSIYVCLLYGLFATCLQYAFTYIGLSRISGSKGAIFDQVSVFAVVLFSGFFFKNDRLSLRKIVGCSLGFLGTIVVSLDGLNFQFSLGGEGMMLLASLCNAAGCFVAKKHTDQIHPLKLVGIGQLFGGILLLVYSLLVGAKITVITPLGVITLLALSLISCIAYVLSLLPLKYHPVSVISTYNLLITVFGAIMSSVMLKENILRLDYLLSIILVSLGIFIVNAKNSQDI